MTKLEEFKFGKRGGSKQIWLVLDRLKGKSPEI